MIPSYLLCFGQFGTAPTWEMLAAANNLEFEKAALCRDQIKELKRAMGGSPVATEARAKPVSYRGGGTKRRTR